MTNPSKSKSTSFHEQPIAAIVALVFLGPLGIYLAWKYKHWSERTRMIASVAGGTIFVVALISSQLKKKDRAEAEAAAKPATAEVAAKVEPAKPTSDKKPVAEAVAPVVPVAPNPPEALDTAPKTPASPEELAALACGQMEFKSYRGGVLTCELDDGIDYDQANLYLITGHSELGDLVPAFDEIKTLKVIVVVEYASIADARGNSKKQKVAEFKISRARAKSINWANIRLNNIPKQIDSSWAKPGVPHLIDG